jgi:protein Tex
VNFESWFQASHSGISPTSIQAVLKLAAEGATLPFIARYRKEQTGNLNEVAIQAILEGRERWDEIIKRQTFILGEIEFQKKLTPELKSKIESTFEMSLLEDLYLPYKQKRKTKATLAKEAGIEPLADWIWNCGHGTETPLAGQTLEIWAFTFRNEEKGFNEVPAVLGGATDILVERLSEKQELRALVRQTLFEKGFLRSQKAEKAKANSKFENYFSYHEPVTSLLQPQNSHRYLALRRGWVEEELTLSTGGAPEDTGFEAPLLQAFETEACTVPNSPGVEILLKSARFAFKVHVYSSIENEVHKALREVAELAAIKVFSENLRKLLLASPFGPKAVLGVDPGIRTGCKLAVVDTAGKYLGSTVMNLQTDEEKARVKPQLVELIKTGQISAVAVGNGTAGRETEAFIRSALKENGIDTPVVMVSEAGASVYSASEAAREEFPELDLTIRGAISIARRLQDPLAELVKIDPKSIGVGQYQHDITPASLKKSLETVVDSCVNSVGVNLNTASYHLLAHVSGIGAGLAKALVTHRAEKGLFSSREDLMTVPRFSQKTFEQAAGFLRIPNGKNPLDNTGVHPEQYPMLENLAKRLNKTVRDFMGAGVELVRKDSLLSQEVGEFTFGDIVRELEKPGRDPRDVFVPFAFREDIHELKDLQPGMICPGIVTNVTNFGAFVDIGVHQDGLVHISQLSEKFVKDPKDVVSPGDRVKIKVLEVNLEKSQISLSMKAAIERPKPPPRPRPEPRQNTQGPQRGRDQKRKPSGPPKSKFTHNPFAALAVLKTKK